MFMDRLAKGSSGKEEKIPEEKRDNWIRSTWHRQEERGMKAEANKNNTTFPLKLDNVFRFPFGVLDNKVRGIT